MRSRRVLVWLLSIPLMLVGSQVGHALAYWLVYPEAQLRARELLATGHSYLDWTPRLFGVALAIETVILVKVAVDGVRRRPTKRHLPVWLFALLPSLAFSIQEFAERWLLTGTIPWWMFEQPTFRVGLLVQLPVGLITYLVARLLLRAAHTLGTALAGRPSVWLGRPAANVRDRLTGVAVRRLRIVCCGWGLRGPPLPVA